MAIQPFLVKFATSYLDDITLYSFTKADHFHHISLFLKKMEEVNLKLHADICDFFQNKIMLLGFVCLNKASHRHQVKFRKLCNFQEP